MKTKISIASVLFFAAAAAFAGAPAKKPIDSYRPLWTESPFTSKPPPPVKPEEVAALEDWVLGGVSEVEGGYMVTIFHKKNAGESQIIRPAGTMVRAKDEMKWLDPGAPGSFKVERVEYGKESWKDTVVYLTSSGRSDKVAFDEKLVTPAASAAPAQNRPPGRPQIPGQLPQPPQPAVQPQVPGVVNPAQPGVRPPRQRVVLPPRR